MCGDKSVSRPDPLHQPLQQQRQKKGKLVSLWNIKTHLPQVRLSCCDQFHVGPKYIFLVGRFESFSGFVFLIFVVFVFSISADLLICSVFLAQIASGLSASLNLLGGAEICKKIG